MVERPVQVHEMINMVLLGGAGSRLFELTRHGDNHQRAKPAVPIFGKYRIVDFVLSNLRNSGCSNFTALLQYGAQPLNNYLSEAWGRTALKAYFAFPQKADLKNVYKGTADAVRQYSWDLSQNIGDVVGIWAGDHISKFDVGPFLRHHQEMGAKFTVSVMPVPVEQAYQFGVLEVDETGKVISFVEKPGGKDNPDAIPPTIPGDSSRVLASLGNYIVDKEYLLEVLNGRPKMHDFGGEIIPDIISAGGVYTYDMSQMMLPGKEKFYWADVGMLKDFFNIHMQMLDPIPPVNLRNEKWPIYFLGDVLPSARSIGSKNTIQSSERAGGCECENSRIVWSSLGRKCDIRNSDVEKSILLGNNNVKDAKLYRTIVDKGISIPPGVSVGRNHDLDEERGLCVYRDEGITIIPRYYKFSEVA